MKISIVVPVFNEERSILEFYDKILPVLDSLKNYTYEIIFVDDGSIDNTFSIINDICNKNINVKGIKLSRNFGKESSMMAGFNNSDSDYIIPIDCDLQDPPELIPIMLKKAQDGYDMVIAKRRARHDNIFKKIFTNIFYLTLNLIDSEKKIYKNYGDFRVFNKKVLEYLLQYKETNLYIKGIFQDIGFKWTTIEFERPERLGQPKQTFFKLFVLSLSALLNSSNNLLFLIFFICLILFTVSIIFILFVFVKKIFFIVPTSGFATISIIVTFFGSLNLLMLSLISLYIHKIYIETKKRPPYIIDKKINL